MKANESSSGSPSRGTRFFACGLVVCVGLACGCDDSKEREAAAEREAARKGALRDGIEREVAERAAAEAARKQEEAEKAEARQRTEEAAAQTSSAEEARSSALDACCLALAKRGFTERSVSDMTAKARCLEAGEQKKTLSDVQAELGAALGERPLPAACGAR